jgi:hypothetical protein
MSQFLRGNFEAKQPVQAVESEEDRLNSQFERTAMKRLGGSIAFVSKKGFVWTGDEGEQTKPGD